MEDEFSIRCILIICRIVLCFKQKCVSLPTGRSLRRDSKDKKEQWHRGAMKEWGVPVRCSGVLQYVALDYSSTPVSVLQYSS